MRGPRSLSPSLILSYNPRMAWVEKGLEDHLVSTPVSSSYMALWLCLYLRESSLFLLSYMCYRLLGSALPLLSLDQLQMVLKGRVMQHYGEHVVTTQVGLLEVLMFRDKGTVLSTTSPLCLSTFLIFLYLRNIYILYMWFRPWTLTDRVTVWWWLQ